eukprot:361255-Chlamydomonas_euryale.AAC.7
MSVCPVLHALDRSCLREAVEAPYALPPLSLPAPIIRPHLDRLRLGIFHKATRVDNDGVGVLMLLHDVKAGAVQVTQQHLACAAPATPQKHGWGAMYGAD